jgi:hypothetical protein
MTVGLLLILVFGVLVGGFLLAGMLSLREFEADPPPVIQPEAVAQPSRPAVHRASAAAPRRSTGDPFVKVLERRLRRELVMAHAYAEDPSVESLWA